MKLVVHPGFGKCASSSLQATLSLSPKQALDSTRSLHYMCIRKDSVLCGSQIIAAAKKSPYGYISSINAEHLRPNAVKLNSLLSDALDALPSSDTAILSCEGWCQDYHSLATLPVFRELGEQCTFVSLVRAPVSWINSAFWQWGAWSGLGQEEWINRAGARGANWLSAIQKCQAIFPEASHKVIPLTRGTDILRTFFLSIGMEDKCFKRLNTISNNISLPLEIIHLYLRYPELRPSPHVSQIDFKISKVLSDSSLSILHRKPWAARYADVVSLTRRLSQPTTELINGYFDDRTRDLVQQDDEWSCTEAYKDREYVSIESLRKTPLFGSRVAEALLRDFAVAINTSKLVG